MIQPTRVKPLNDQPVRRGVYVLYWMQQSQRAEWNHALEYAIRQANALGLPVVAGFGLTDAFPDATLRHYRFMLEGLRETQHLLRRRGIQMVVRRGAPDKVAADLGRRAALLVADRGYLSIQKAWRANVAAGARCRVVQVESDVVVPVQTASDKEEYAARTIRPKLHRLLADYLVPLRHRRPKRDSLGLRLRTVSLAEPDAALAGLRIDRSVGPSPLFRGGTREAKRRLARFIRSGLPVYDRESSDPAADGVSHLSPYLHFGQISPLYVALQVLAKGGKRSAGADSYLEQLIIRRELSMNFVNYRPDYGAFSCIPDWAGRTLSEHAADPREYVYSLRQWERAETHDPYWNAAQHEMAAGGKMHNYMRMYWGKKVIEWSKTPQEAFRTLLYLNNKYELDGRDANGFTGVAWCFGKHDRAWSERAVLGKLRYMSAAGLDRKFHMPAYLRRVGEIEGGRNE